MVTVAVISEYNPFHNGHEYHIKKIREQFGEDTAIVAIMSANYTQRAECAVADKSVRAKAAVECGVDLVLEIPFPFCSSSAQFYAESGVKIADSIGVIDYLSFGSECGSIDVLTDISTKMTTDVYKNAFLKLKNDKDNKTLGYAELCEKAFLEAFAELDIASFFTPNNILGAEYIKALIGTNSKLKPHTIKRIGADYNETNIIEQPYQSASAIRAALSDGMEALSHVPQNARAIYEKAYADGLFPTDMSKLSHAVISSFMLNSPSDNVEIHDASGGLYNRLKNNCYHATSISELVSLTETKKYTNARIRRAILNSFFGVTSSEVKELPLYTQVLAMNQVGRKILKRIKKESDFPVITKPSSTSTLTDEALRQKERANTADAIFGLTLPMPKSGDNVLKFTPYVKE